jgi:ribosomal protein S19E (S16A)
MNQTLKNAAQYVKNTNGGATRSHFIEDHEPVGVQLWEDLSNAGLVRQDENPRIHLTEAGGKLLSA